MSIVAETTLAYLPAKQKTSPKGWRSFNAPCCHHNGERPDTRQRGGLIANGDGGISYHCFNCGYKTSWQPGRQLTFKYQTLLRWLHVPDDTINKLALQVLRENEGVEAHEHIVQLPKFEPLDLPKDSQKISECTSTSKFFVRVVEYMQSRQLFLDDYDFYWSKDLAWRDRLIIPFHWEGNVVGYTARSVDSDKRPKYLASEPEGFVFNLDAQTYDKQFVIVHEGPIDAIYTGGTALLGSEIGEQQELMINRLNKDVIVVPDRDTAGKKLVEDAISRGWQVSMPEWETDINDAGDAVERYGRLYTLYSIVQAAETSPLKNRLRAKKWFISKNS